MYCDLVPTNETRNGRYGFKCIGCGREYWSNYMRAEQIRGRACTAAGQRPRLPTLPPLHKRLANFSRASIEHAQAGFPTCTQEQIDERHATCIACDTYLPNADNPAIGNCTHSSCGCPVTRLDKFVSKLAWADQKCPLGKWPPIAP